ncbi:fluoride efflux transporter FluC [Bacillus sp. AK128]
MKNSSSIYVAIGGFIGAGARYGIYLSLPIPLSLLGTFLCNMLGCLLIGLFYEFLNNRSKQRELWLLLGTGFCGGFTTMSAFSGELVQLGESGQILLLVFYLLGTWLMGIFLTIVGIKLATLLLDRKERLDRA